MQLKNKIPLIFCLIFLTSCNEFQRVLKSEDIKLKYEVAEKYYEAQEFRRASRLFEQIQSQYRGKPQAERVTFFYANSLLNTKKYIDAGYQFESFIKAYPLSQKVDEAAYLGAYSYYKTSPVFSLDQKKLLQQLKNFKNL